MKKFKPKHDITISGLIINQNTEGFVATITNRSGAAGGLTNEELKNFVRTMVIKISHDDLFSLTEEIFHGKPIFVNIKTQTKVTLVNRNKVNGNIFDDLEIIL